MNAADEWDWWWGSWRNLIRCGRCTAFMDMNLPCPICSNDYRSAEPDFTEMDGHRVPSRVFQGPLDWSPYLMLRMMHRDWIRPIVSDDIAPSGQPSARAVVVIIFWTYFETLMSSYYDAATRHLPEPVARDLLKRHSSIGSRMDRLNRILSGCSFGDGLEMLGYIEVRAHLARLQKQRNAFVHGDPAAIDDALVDETIRLLPDFHQAWIASFNQNCALRS